MTDIVKIVSDEESHKEADKLGTVNDLALAEAAHRMIDDGRLSAVLCSDGSVRLALIKA